VKMTEKAIERLKTPATRRDIRDESSTGLYLRHMPSGKKIWRLRYMLRGKARIMRIGEWPGVSVKAARAEATTAAQLIEKGRDPAAEQQRAEAQAREMPTVEEFAKEYIERYAEPKKKSAKQDEQIIARWLLPKLGRLRMDEVSRRDIVAIMDRIRDTGATRMPGKFLAVARMMFKFAIQRGVLESTPCLYIEEPQPRPAQRAMTAEAIRHWWNSTGEAIESTAPAIGKPTALALRLLLLTGQRPGEVANATRDEFHLDSEFGPHWIIAGERRKKGRAAQGSPHAVALEPEAVATIKRALKLSNGEYLFEKPSGGPIRTDSHLSAGLVRLYAGRDDRPTPHGARHTVATELAELGIDEYRIGRVLGHVSKTVTGTVYINRRVNEAALRGQRALLSAWERRLVQIIEGDDLAAPVRVLEAIA